MYTEVTTLAAALAALQAGSNLDITGGEFTLEVSVGKPVIRISAGAKIRLVAWGSSQPHVVAWGSSQPHVEARESSQPHVEARESSQPHVVAWESSQPHVVAWESSQPHVVARESSQPHVVAWESSQPHVVAWGSSQPHVVAEGFVQLSILGRVIAKATAKVCVLIKGTGAEVTGGHQVVMTASPEEVARLDQVREIVLSKPQRLRMDQWHSGNWTPDHTPEEEHTCGSAHCIAGWLQALSPDPKVRKMEPRDAGAMLCPTAVPMFHVSDAVALKWLDERAYAPKDGE